VLERNKLDSVVEFQLAANELMARIRKVYKPKKVDISFGRKVDEFKELQMMFIKEKEENKRTLSGEYGLILLERAISRMTYVGAPLFFQFDTIAKNIGCYESNSVAQFGNLTFFLSDDGFYVCDGQTVIPIGAEKIDRFFFTFVDQTKLNEMNHTIKEINQKIH
jgi:hypothetical protein